MHFQPRCVYRHFCATHTIQLHHMSWLKSCNQYRWVFALVTRRSSYWRYNVDDPFYAIANLNNSSSHPNRFGKLSTSFGWERVEGVVVLRCSWIKKVKLHQAYRPVTGWVTASDRQATCMGQPTPLLSVSWRILHLLAAVTGEGSSNAVVSSASNLAGKANG